MRPDLLLAAVQVDGAAGGVGQAVAVAGAGRGDGHGRRRLGTIELLALGNVVGGRADGNGAGSNGDQKEQRHSSLPDSF